MLQHPSAPEDNPALDKAFQIADVISSEAVFWFSRNLMLPRGMISERPWACFHVRIYKADGLPSMDSGLMAKMAVVTDRTVFIDPYVQVTFAGQQVQR